MLARSEGWRAERRDPGIQRVWCRGERTYERRPNRDGRENVFYDVERCDFHSPDSAGRAGLFCSFKSNAVRVDDTGHPSIVEAASQTTPCQGEHYEGSS